ncbi:unnamed protein product, partial [Didymodactylos carnosus]
MYPNNRQNSYSTAHIVSNSLDLVNDYVYDPNTQIHYNMYRNVGQNRVPAPSATNLMPVNSPARSVRRMHSGDSEEDDFTTVSHKKKRNSNRSNNYQQQRQQQNDFHTSPSNQTNQPFSQRTATNLNLNRQNYQQNQNISIEATRNVPDKQAAEEVLLHYKHNYQIDILINNYHSSTLKCGANEVDINELSGDLKALFPEIHNVVRLKNKFQQDIRMVKVEFASATIRDDILNSGKINVNFRSYDIEEYLAPACVLICSRCMGIGHFKKQCTQLNETCKICGQSSLDLKQHICTMQPKCVHCAGNH